MFLKNVVLHEIYSKKSQKVTGQKVTDEKSQDKKSQFKFCILTKHIYRTKSHNITFCIGAYH